MYNYDNSHATAKSLLLLNGMTNHKMYDSLVIIIAIQVAYD